MTDGPPTDGMIDYLVYLVAGLCTVVFGLVQKTFNRRIVSVEDESKENWIALHNVERDMKTNCDENNKFWDDRFEKRRLETKRDFQLLHKKIEGGHKAILDEIREMRK